MKLSVTLILMLRKGEIAERKSYGRQHLQKSCERCLRLFKQLRVCLFLRHRVVDINGLSVQTLDNGQVIRQDKYNNNNNYTRLGVDPSFIGGRFSFILFQKSQSC